MKVKQVYKCDFCGKLTDSDDITRISITKDPWCNARFMEETNIRFDSDSDVCYECRCKIRKGIVRAFTPWWYRITP